MKFSVRSAIGLCFHTPGGRYLSINGYGQLGYIEGYKFL